jgi:hypothetical protein
MRVSADRSDPGYAQYKYALARGVTYDVQLDSELLTKHVVTADEETGEVVRFKTGPDGKLVITMVDGNRRVDRETLRGAVRLIERNRR